MNIHIVVFNRNLSFVVWKFFLKVFMIWGHYFVTTAPATRYCFKLQIIFKTLSYENYLKEIKRVWPHIRFFLLPLLINPCFLQHDLKTSNYRDWIFVLKAQKNQAHIPQKAPSNFDSSLLSPQWSIPLQIVNLWIYLPLLHWNNP